MTTNPATTLTTTPTFDVINVDGPVRTVFSSQWRQDVGRYLVDHWHEIDALGVLTRRTVFGPEGTHKNYTDHTTGRAWYGHNAT